MLLTWQDFNIMKSEKGAHVAIAATVGTFGIRQIAGK